MKKILISALVVGCFVLAGYAYTSIKPDNASIAKNTPEISASNKVAGAAKASKETTADPVPIAPTNTSSTKVNKRWTMSDSSVLYKNLDELVERADYVFECEIIEVSYFDYNGGTNTKLLVKVMNSYSPEIKAGEVLTFSEAGGITTQANIMRRITPKFGVVRSITEAEENEEVILLRDGRALTKVGERYVYFAVKITGSGWNPIPGTDYGAIGGYQGQFKIQNGEAERYDPEPQTGSKYSSLKMKKTDFDKKLRLALENKK